MKRTGFTLVELIVVISIISIVIAVILPSLNSSKLKARVVQCKVNVKQLNWGLLQYEAEHKTLPYSFWNPDSKNILPPGGYYVGNPSIDRGGWWWFNYTEKYKKSDGIKSIVQCPSKLLTEQKLNNNILCGNYGVNRSICKSSDDRQGPTRDEFVGTPLKTTGVPNPAQTLLIVDSGYAMISWWYAATAPPFTLGSTPIEDTAYIPGLSINKTRNLMRGQEQDAIKGRHYNKTVNVGFVDGHIELKKAEKLLVEKTNQGYTNKIPLWTIR
jgi:prepilin-type N-terminal cleavage/methylation domain-containing protein/prepilin-type processing-associated H-X9-DG protein